METRFCISIGNLHPTLKNPYRILTVVSPQHMDSPGGLVEEEVKFAGHLQGPVTPRRVQAEQVPETPTFGSKHGGQIDVNTYRW